MILNCFWWSDTFKYYILIIICVTEPRPREPLQSPSQAPQAWGKKKGPPEVRPPQAIPPPEVMAPQAIPRPEVMPPQAIPRPEVMPPQAIPHKTRDTGLPSGQPPPRVKGPGYQPQHVVEPAGTTPGLGGLKGPVPSQELSLVAPGGKGPRGPTPQPLSQAPSSSHAPAGKIASKYGTFRPTFCQIFQQLVLLFLKILVISLELCIHKYSSKHCLFV